MLTTLDTRLFDILNRGAANPFLDWLMPRVTNLHHQKWFVALAVLAAVAVVWRGSRWVRVAVVCLLVALGVSDLACSRVVKAVTHRDRPCHQVVVGGPMAYPQTRLVGGCPGSSSFPSNHSSNMMAVGIVGWWFSRRRARWFWLLLPLVIGYSRIYLGYHYPTDVVSGWLLGGSIGAAAIVLARRWLPAPASPDAGVREADAADAGDGGVTGEQTRG